MAFPQMSYSVSATTRAPRDGERDGVDYHFFSKEQFRELIATRKLAEYEEVYPGLYYGTLHTELARANRSHPLLLDLDVKGARALKHRYPQNTLTIFLCPPSIEILRQRLQMRGTENASSLQRRLQRVQEEMSYAPYFDITVINDTLEEAVEEACRHVQHFLYGS